MPMSVPIKRALFAFSDISLRSRSALSLQVRQQLLDSVFLL
jgi:hypothetical protein